MSLTANQALKDDGSVITISGLCGTITNEDVVLAAGAASTTISATGTFLQAGAWDRDASVLKITTGSAGMLKDTDYVFTFTWKLQDSQKDACPITIMASGTNTFVSMAMTNDAGKAGKVLSPPPPSS